ncbi:MAG: GGDEF domain-containing protein [Deferrisomatales bacterium]
MATFFPDATPLPPDALPFVREFLLEVARRIPPALGSPPRFQAAGLRDPAGCTDAVRVLLRWLDAASDTAGEQMEELEDLFLRLLDVIQKIDGQIHRAVLHSRGWVEDDMVFNRSVQEVVQELLGDPPHPADPAAERLAQVAARLAAKTQADRAEALALSAQFEGVQHHMDELRQQIAEVEGRTRQIREQSLRDPLTGLWNRRAYDGRMGEEVARARRYGVPLSVALWDLDHFKRVNDAHGHQAGDLALQCLSGRLVGMLRSSDFVARLGGEEFAAVLPNTDLHRARVAGEKIRASVAGGPVELPSGPLQITVSVGLATFEPGDQPDDLLRRADEALYRAKARGRNRVEAPAPMEVAN